MGAAKDMWIREHEQIGDDFVDGTIDREQAERRLKSLGFDPHEIREHLDALDEDRTSVGVPVGESF